MSINVSKNSICCLENLNSNLMETCLVFNSFKNSVSSFTYFAYVTIISSIKRRWSDVSFSINGVFMLFQHIPSIYLYKLEHI